MVNSKQGKQLQRLRLFLQTAKKQKRGKVKCSLFRQEYLGIKIASYIILNKNQSPLRGLRWKLTFLHASLLGKKSHAEQRSPPTGKGPIAVQVNTLNNNKNSIRSNNRRRHVGVLLWACWSLLKMFPAITSLSTRLSVLSMTRESNGQASPPGGPA